MNTTTSLFGLTLLVSVSLSPAHALEITPYTPQALAAKQQAGETVGLHFHAKWCPICWIQEKVFNTFKDDAAVPGTMLVVDYDRERDLRRDMGVRGQSTLIVFKGKEERYRSGGVTDTQALREAWTSVK